MDACKKLQNHLKETDKTTISRIIGRATLVRLHHHHHHHRHEDGSSTWQVRLDVGVGAVTRCQSSLALVTAMMMSSGILRIVGLMPAKLPSWHVLRVLRFTLN